MVVIEFLLLSILVAFVLLKLGAMGLAAIWFIRGTAGNQSQPVTIRESSLRPENARSSGA